VDGCGGGRLTERALELAYGYLSRRERTVNEVRRHLLREVDEASAGAAIDELADQGVLDDVRFARLFVQDKRELEQWGNERIRRGLVARGIDPDLADAALAAPDAALAAPDAALAAPDAALAAPEAAPSELTRALGLLRQRFPQPPHGRRERERALGLLLRKGYEPELALDALEAHGRDQAA
jgi:regulatory protein